MTTVRQALSSDSEPLAELKLRAAGAAYAGQCGASKLRTWLEANATQSYFAWRIGRKDYYVLVAENERGELLGYLGFRQRGDRADLSSVGMYVDPDRQGTGAGRQLLDAFHSLCAELGCARARTSIWRTHTGGQRFWQRQGFAATGKGFRDQITGLMVDHYERALT